MNNPLLLLLVLAINFAALGVVLLIWHRLSRHE
jgi:hypothetical protein